MAALGLRCCTWAFSRCGGQILLAASLVVEHGGFRACGLQSAGSVVVAHGLSCPVACAIFPDQASNLCPLHWQAASYPLEHKGSPVFLLIMVMVQPLWSSTLGKSRPVFLMVGPATLPCFTQTQACYGPVVIESSSPWAIKIL